MSKKNYQEKIDIAKEKLKPVKNLAKGTEEYKVFLESMKQMAASKAEYLEKEEEEKFLKFGSFQLFVGEFGPWFAMFVYTVFVLYRSFLYEKGNIGIKFIHTTFLIGPVFYLYWTFQPFNDVTKVSYYFAGIVTPIFIALSMYIYTKQRKDKLDSLQENLMEVAKFTFKNTKPEKREEMLDMIKKIAKNK
ncbi:hypothetical protein [Tenacibaculum mesophilum]|uniref:hypothetical protein n=1 Tax=Tenacibaculum mesophilum TaxID=104268 RepID=UPI00249388A2|nr:hypothetical protein [Tenacibaculum mesophilum]